MSDTEPTDQIAQGPARDYCPRWPEDGHSMSGRKPADARISIRSCDGCGWVDGQDLERQAAKKAKKKIRKLRAKLVDADLAISVLNSRIRMLDEKIADMKAHWRPIPIAHEWQPRDPHCLFCDDPREAVRHMKTSWSEEYGPDTQPPPEQADESEAP